jgi:HK97 family phage portal protein
VGLLDRIFRPFVTRAVGSPLEGQPRPGPWYLPVTGGHLPAEVGKYWNWWQMGYDVQSYSPSAMVEACVKAYSETIAMCSGSHWFLEDNGGRERVTTSALSRILKKPNSYDTASDFILNLVRDLYIDGNAYALALRNDRYEITELHPMEARVSSPQVAEGGEVFYRLGGNVVIDRLIDMANIYVPARDVLHVRLNTSPYNNLKGESPLLALARDLAATDAIAAQQLQFYLNQARPSIVLTTDMILDKDQVNQIRDRWNEQVRGLNAGGTPILTAGLKPQTLSATAEQSQLADIMKLTEQHIAMAYRIPLQLLGLGGSPFGSTEALMQYWLATSLGFALNHVEEAFDKLFDLKGQPDEYTEFDTSALLRSSMKERIESFARGVQSGIYSPNEARAEEDLKRVPFGDEPRVQAQVVPLSAATGIPSAPSAPAAPAPVKPSAPPAPPKPQVTAASLQRRLRVSYQRHSPQPAQIEARREHRIGR